MVALIKSIKNRAFRTSFLQGYQIYWEALSFLKQLKFSVSRIRFSLRQWYKEKYQSAPILWLFFKKSIWSIAGAILLISSLRVLEQNIPSPQLFSLTKDSFVGTYGVLAQISGLILALYFTAMIIIVSTIYSRVPENIRNLIAREKVGDRYISLLMFLGVTVLIELSAILYGKDPSLMVLCVVLLISLMALLALRILIHNIFNFFDPARLAEAYIFSEATNWVSQSTCRYQGWDNPSFQYHCYKQANQYLLTYKNIIDLLTRDPSPDNASLTRLMSKELSFLSLYTRIKNQIPTDSRWYEYQAEHPKWFETSFSLLGIAMESNTPLFPEEKPNHLWVEERVANNLRVILSYLLKNKDLEHAIELIQQLQESCTVIVKTLALKEAYFLTGVCDELIVKYLSTADLDDKNKIYQLALADLYGSRHVNIPIEYAKILEEISSDSLRNKLQSINWKNPASVYKVRLPVSLLPVIEDILRQKQNQFIVDSSVEIPEWYDLELIAIECLKFLHETTEEVVSQYEQAFINKIEEIKGKNATLLMMQILTRGLEGYNKCSTFISMAEKLDKGLHGLVIVEDIPHSTLEWSTYKKRIEDMRSKIIERFGLLALDIDPEDIDKSVSDYVGHAYWLVARECFLALCEQDEEKYATLYTNYILLMNRMWTYFSSILNKEKNTEYYTAAFSEIFIDAMVIGGYAKLFNEFRKGNYWEITTNVWDAYLKSSEQDNKDILSVFLAMAKYKNQPLASITSRGMERTGWRQNYNRIIKIEIDLSDDYFDRGPVRSAQNKIKSALLRSFGESFSMYQAESVFIHSYILQKPEMKEAEVDQKTKQFIESLIFTLKGDKNANDE